MLLNRDAERVLDVLKGVHGRDVRVGRVGRKGGEWLRGEGGRRGGWWRRRGGTRGGGLGPVVRVHGEGGVGSGSGSGSGWGRGGMDAFEGFYISGAGRCWGQLA